MPAGRSGRRGRVGVLAVLLVLWLALLSGCGATTVDRPASGASVDPVSGLPYLDQDQLPAPARQTIKLIDAGGPYPYDQDGEVFGNREGILPKEPDGYYHEYTVPTPGEHDRGARRIVTGDQDTIFYYSDDHYDSFSRIRR
ncbi:MAG TPA: ribonuclease domain-containing protein [Microlunatus sp.]